MTTNMIGLLGAGVLALWYLCLVHARESWGRSVLKTGAVLMLALMAALKMPLLAVALGLCALGDLALSRPGERAFLAGVASFAAGHLAYVWLFLSLPGSDPERLATAPMLWAVLLLFLIAIGMARMLARHAGEMRVAVLLYVPVIVAMALAGFTLPQPLIWGAAVMFMLSDMVLAVETFVLPPAHRARRLTAPTVWVLYWGAQALFFAVLIL
ncbi:lysoplasmalogenase [Tritonibacter mobilis]|uniref:lysoplasmalogenase n=1 Tax=Tritonibacter mobilis TaxID=379347 RepID=UPI001CDA080B|nr:lysoplasmalogenase [Tritonibacter mobilis]MCA2009297.1 lysoplasmalogenase [Tritonibacter mobilis]